VSARLVAQLARRGIKVRRVGDDQLGVTAPEGGLSQEAVAYIREHKGELLAALPTAELPASLDAQWRRAAMEAGSITWLDQVLLWPADVYKAWEGRAGSLERDAGLSPEAARASAYGEYRQHNVTSFPTEEPSAEGRAL
jgi:tubulysin polyketide synthase-like protein